MAQGTVALAGHAQESAQVEPQTKQKTYGRAVLNKLLRDKITIFSMALLVFMIGITLGASWIGENVLGFDPTDTNLRMRNKAPTWANEAWPVFQSFTSSCALDEGCDWSSWGEIFSLSSSGLGECIGAGLGECHWMGTDEAGRDVLTRAIHGGRISLRIGFWVALVSMTLGVGMGLISGYYATTWIDDVINAVIMTLGSIPLLFLLIILSSIFRPSPEGLAILIGLFGWMGLSRLVRGQIFSIREREYIIASQAIGTPAWKIMLRHVLPNVSSIIIVSAIFAIAGAIIAEAGLSFLGVGIGPPNPSWGNMMEKSLGSFQNAPWLVIAPGVFISITVLGILLFGDGLRDAMDPWIKK